MTNSAGQGYAGPTGPLPEDLGGQDAARDIGTLFSQSILVLAGLISRIGFLMLFEAVAARHLGPADYGLFSLAFTVTLVAAALPSLGLQTALSRFIALYRETGESAKLRGMLTLSLLWPPTVGLAVAAILFLGAPALATKVFGKPEVAPLLRILALVVPLWSARRLAVSIFSGYKRPLYKVALEDFTEPLVRVGAAVSVAVAGLGVVALGYTTLAAYVIVAVAARILVAKASRTPRIDAAGRQVPWGQVAAFSSPLVLSDLAEIVLAWIDTLMLGIFSAEYQVGLFRSASQPAMLASAVLTSFAFIYLPIATRMFARRDQAGWKEANSAVARWTLSLAFPIAACCVLFPEPIIEILFGPQFREGACVMQILGITYLIHAGVGFTGLNLIIAGHTTLQMIGKLISIGTHLGLNLLWIPRYGAIGAACATLVSVVFSNGYNLVLIRRRLGLLQFTRRYFALAAIHLVATAGLALGAHWTGASPVAGLFCVGILELPLACGLAIALGVITQSDRDLIAGFASRLTGKS